jgi:hypothetical protein
MAGTAGAFVAAAAGTVGGAGLGAAKVDAGKMAPANTATHAAIFIRNERTSEVITSPLQFYDGKQLAVRYLGYILITRHQRC